ncbi:MAG: cation transporter [Thioalkalispiraceae bacterium]
MEKLRERQYGTLKIVLAINLTMFLVEIIAGLLASSTALLADSLDMLGDSIVYGFSLYVVAKSVKWKAISAIIKGSIMAIFGFFVLGQAIYKIIYPVVPTFEAIGIVGLLALTANGVCLLLLWKHKSEDINMKSVWVCSRNDIIANFSVLLAAVGVWLSQNQWPDVLVGIAIALLFLRSAYYVLREAFIIKAQNQNE